MKRMLSMVVCAAYVASLGTTAVSAAPVLNTDISDGETVVFDKGVIKLDTTLTLNELKDGLKLVKGDGSAILGGQYIRAIENDETYEYELVMGALEHNESYELFYYNDDIVAFDANGYIVNEDFDDWTDADITDLTDGNGKDGLYMMLKENDAERNPVVSLKDKDGGKYLAIESGWTSELTKPNSRTRLYATDFGLLRKTGEYEDLLYVTGDWKWYGTSSDTSVGTARNRRMAGLAAKAKIHEDKSLLANLVNSTQIAGVSWMNVAKNGDFNSVEGKTFDNGWHAWNILYQKANYAVDIKFDNTRVSGGWGAYTADDYDSVLLGFFDTNTNDADAAFAVDNLKVEKVKGPQVIYTSAVYDNNELIEGDGTVDVYFNTDIKASSVADITMTDKNGASVATGVEYNASTRSAKISYSGLTDGETYTVTVPNTVVSEKSVSVNSVAQYAVMQAKTIAFTAVAEVIEPAPGTTADIENGAVIPFDKGIITITSDDYSFDTISENLELTKADGSAIKGTYYVKETDNGVDVVFGDLEYNTAYSITCGEYELNFTTSGVAFEEDFNDWTDADLTALTSVDGKDNLFLMKRDKDSENDPIVTLKDKGDGDKYLDVDGRFTGSVRFRLYTGNLGLIRDEEGNADYLQVYGDWKFYGSEENPYGMVRGNNASYKLLGGLTSVEAMQSKDKGMYEMPNSTSTPNANWVGVSSDGKTYNKVENAGNNGIGNDFSRVQMLWATAGNISTGNYEVNTKANNERIGTTDGNLSGSDYNAVALGYFMTHSTQGCDVAMSIDNISIEKIKAPRILKTSVDDREITAGNGAVDVYFSTDVDASTLTTDTILIKDSENVNRVTGITYSEQERKATVVYAGLLEGEAVLDFVATPAVNGEGYAAIRSAKKGTGNESHAPSMKAQSYSLSAVEGSGEGGEVVIPFVCSSINLSSTVNVEPTIGKIIVNFTKEVDDSTISGITMKDSDGNTAPNFAVTAAGITCVLTFSPLESGTRYIITVPGSVKSMDGDYVAEKTFSFRTATDYIVDLDFEDYDVVAESDNTNISGTHPNTDEGITYTSGNIAGDVSNMYIMEEGSNRFLRIYSEKSADGSAKDDKVNVPVVLDGTNSASVEMKVRWAASDNSYGGNGISGCIGRIDAPKMANVFNANRTDGSIGSNNSGRLVAQGQGVGTWLDIKLVYTPDTDGVYIVHGYYNGEYITSVKETTTVSSITSILLQHVYNKSTSLAAWGDLDDIKVKYVPAPGVVNTNLVDNTMPVTGQILELYFSDEMDSDTVKDSNITVTYTDIDSQEKTVETTGIYYPATNKYVISFPDYLTPDKEYKVNFSGVRSVNRILVSQPFTFMSGSTGLTLNSAIVSETTNGTSIDKIPESGNVVAKANVGNKTGKEEKVVVILASYDSEGRSLDVVAEEYTVSAGNTKTATCEITATAEAAEVRMYVWNGFETICPILTTPITIN